LAFVDIPLLPLMHLVVDILDIYLVVEGSLDKDNLLLLIVDMDTYLYCYLVYTNIK